MYTFNVYEIINILIKPRNETKPNDTASRTVSVLKTKTNIIIRVNKGNFQLDFCSNFSKRFLFLSKPGQKVDVFYVSVLNLKVHIYLNLRTKLKATENTGSIGEIFR